MSNPYERSYSEPSTSAIHPSVRFGKNVRIGHYVVIEKGCKIGDNTQIESLVFICQDIEIGNNCVIRAGSIVTIDIPDGMVVVGNQHPPK